MRTDALARMNNPVTAASVDLCGHGKLVKRMTRRGTHAPILKFGICLQRLAWDNFTVSISCMQ